MRRTVTTLVAAAALLFTGASPAVAANLGDYTLDGVRIRSAPAAGSVLGLGYRGQGVCTYGWEYAGGAYWAHHRNLATGVTGWSLGHYVSHYGTC